MRVMYILPFKNGQHFKVGITDNIHNRIYQLSMDYEIDLEKALVAMASKSRTIEVLEKHILNLWSTYPSIYIGKSGYKEVRDMAIFEDLILEIQSMNKSLEIRLASLLSNQINTNTIRKTKHPLEKKYDIKFNHPFIYGTNYKESIRTYKGESFEYFYLDKDKIFVAYMEYIKDWDVWGCPSVTNGHLEECSFTGEKSDKDVLYFDLGAGETHVCLSEIIYLRGKHYLKAKEVMKR